MHFVEIVLLELHVSLLHAFLPSCGLVVHVIWQLYADRDAIDVVHNSKVLLVGTYVCLRDLSRSWVPTHEGVLQARPGQNTGHLRQRGLVIDHCLVFIYLGGLLTSALLRKEGSRHVLQLYPGLSIWAGLSSPRGRLKLALQSVGGAVQLHQPLRVLVCGHGR